MRIAHPLDMQESYCLGKTQPQTHYNLIFHTILAEVALSLVLIHNLTAGKMSSTWKFSIGRWISHFTSVSNFCHHRTIRHRQVFHKLLHTNSNPLNFVASINAHLPNVTFPQDNLASSCVLLQPHCTLVLSVSSQLYSSLSFDLQHQPP